VEYGGSSPSGNTQRGGISNTSAGYEMIRNLHGYSSKNLGNASDIYNNILNVGVDEGPLRTQLLLSPLEAHRRNQGARNHRLDGAGDWFLQSNGFESWHNGQDGSVNPTLLCYGGQGIGKTCIRYESNSQGTMHDADRQ